MRYLDSSETSGRKARGKYKMMQRDILNKSWKQHFMNQQLYSHLPTILQTIQER